MYLFNGICLTDNLVKNLHRQVATGLRPTDIGDMACDIPANTLPR